MSSTQTGVPGTGRILFVSHEASLTGAPMFLLHFLRWLKRETSQPFEILLRRDGPLSASFAELGTVRGAAWLEERPERITQYALVYSNTAANGLFLEQFPLGAIRVVTHVHELDHGIDTYGARNFAQIVRHTDRFIACAGAVAASLGRRFGIAPDRIHTHFEMFDPQRTDANARQRPAGDVRQEFNLPPEARVIAACGTVDQRKGADLFLQLAARLRRRWRGDRPLRFLWIGKENEPAFSQLLRHDLRRLGLTDGFTLTGEQANPHALLALADIFCLTSREDPFPLVMLEATALGKPLVCFDGSGGAAELCALGAGQAVPFLDVAEMAEHCLGLLADEPARLAAGEAAARIVRERFTPPAVAPALWKTLSDLLRAPAAGRPEWNLSPVEIQARWNSDSVPDALRVSHAIQRAKLVSAARAHAAGGRTAEAGRMLLRAVNTAMESRDGHVIIDSLLEISRELAPLDAPRAAELCDQAQQMLARVPPGTDAGKACHRDLAALQSLVRLAGRQRQPRVA